MIQLHSSTAQQRAQWVSILVAQEGSYGVVSQLGKEAKVSRQTLYSWKAKGRGALQAAFEPQEPQARTPLERAVLTLLVEGHASYRGIQTCLAVLLGKPGQPGNDHGHRTRGRRACAKVVAAASLRARTRVGLG
jgi:hypothetical protein